MSKNSSSLSPYYKKYALIKDTSRLERVIAHLNTVENLIQIKLPYNSSLMNQWPDYALQLSGLWTPTLKSCPISSGLDIAGSLVEETMAIPMPQPLCTNQLFSESISNSPFQKSNNFPIEDLNTRMNIDLFLQKVDEMEEDDTAVEAQTDEQQSTVANENLKKENHSETAPSGSNSLSNLMQKSWCSDMTSAETISPNDERDRPFQFQRSLSLTSSASSLRSPAPDRCSYNSLLRKHEKQREVDWTEVWEKFLLQNSTGLAVSETTINCDDECGSNKSEDFEVVSGGSLEKFDIQELQEMVEQLCKLAREPGLDAQGFLCKSCQHPLGIGYSNFR